MSTATQLRHCGECERSITKAHRIERDVAYCATCYSRVFIHKDCSRCGQTMRAHRYDTAPVCRSCRNQGRSCRRCGKSIGKKAGLIVGGQPICNACAPHFREPRPCSNCGRLSSRLSRAAHLGFDDPVCERCYQLDHVTCGQCGKYRRVEKLDAKGKPLCRTCSQSSVKEHLCPDCGVLVEGAGKAHCQRCSNNRKLKQHALINVEMMEQVWCRDLFLQLCAKLSARVSDRRLPFRLHKYALFFTMLDKHLCGVEEITQDRLFGLYGAEGMRRHQVVVTFLCEQHFLSWSLDRQEELIEKRRINANIETTKSSEDAQLLSAYELYLRQTPKRNGNDRHLRTVRSYVSAARKLLEFCQPDGVTQVLLESFCKRSRGHSASLFAFVAFLRMYKGRELIVSSRRRKDPKVLEKEAQQKMRNLLVKLQHAEAMKKRKALLAALLSHLHGLRIVDVLSLRLSHIERKGGSLGMYVNGEFVRLHEQVAEMISALMKDDNPDLYLFNSHIVGRPISSATVQYHVRSV